MVIEITMAITLVSVMLTMIKFNEDSVMLTICEIDIWFNDYGVANNEYMQCKQMCDSAAAYIVMTAIKRIMIAYTLKMTSEVNTETMWCWQCDILSNQWVWWWWFWKVIHYAVNMVIKVTNDNKAYNFDNTDKANHDDDSYV